MTVIHILIWNTNVGIFIWFKLSEQNAWSRIRKGHSQTDVTASKESSYFDVLCHLARIDSIFSPRLLEESCSCYNWLFGSFCKSQVNRFNCFDVIIDPFSYRVRQIVEVIDPRNKERRLFELLHKYHKSRKNRVLVFVLYKKEAVRVQRALWNGGWEAAAIHGKEHPLQPLLSLKCFKTHFFPQVMLHNRNETRLWLHSRAAKNPFSLQPMSPHEASIFLTWNSSLITPSRLLWKIMYTE